MKTCCCLKLSALVLASASMLSVSFGETFKTKRGKEYRDCEVIGKDAYGVTFRHEGGMARIGYADLPEGMQKRFNYDPVEAKRFVDVRRPKPPIVRRPAVVKVPVPQRVVEGALAARPRGRNIRNPYLLAGSLYNPAAYGASFGGFVQPYYSGQFGTPELVTTFPGGFFTPDTLRLGAKPVLDSPVATSIGSYSQYRDARASAVRAAARALPRPVRAVPLPKPVLHGGGHRGGGKR